MKTPQQELQELARLFDDRHKWWEQTVARAEEAKKRHFARFAQSCEKLRAAEICAAGFHRAAAIAGDKKAALCDLGLAYKSLRVFEKEIADPLRAIKPHSRISNVHAEKWDQFAQLLEQGREWRAYDVLKTMRGGRMRRFVDRLRYGYTKSDQQELEKDIERALRYMDKYRDTAGKIVRTREEIENAENRIGRKLYKMLADKTVQAMLRDNGVKNAAKTSGELAFLVRYADTGFDMTEEKIRRDLSAQRGKLTLPAVRATMSMMAREMPHIIHTLRQQSILDGRRHEAASRFARSAAVAQRLETKTSRLVDGWHGDLRAELKSGTHMTDEDAASLIDNARTKMRRWINLSQAQRSLDLIGQDDFDPAALPRMPWHSYAINAGIDSGRRVMWKLPAKAFNAIVTGLGATALILTGKIRDIFSQSSVSGRTNPTPSPAPRENQRKSGGGAMPPGWSGPS